MEAEVDSITVYVWPKVKLVLDVEHRNTLTTMTLYYNLAANSLELPYCPTCHRPFTTVCFDRHGKYSCPDCARQG